MIREQWAAHIRWCVSRAAAGHPARLDVLAQRLADHDLACDVLASAGYGENDDPLLERLAAVLEHVDQMRDEVFQIAAGGVIEEEGRTGAEGCRKGGGKWRPR